MKKYTIYIVAIIFLVIGTGVGWLAQSLRQGKVTLEDMHDHDKMASNKTEEEIWTCSMHPQIRQNEFGICPICEMDLIPLDNSMTNDDPTILQMSKESVKLAQVETFVVGNGNARSVNEVTVDGTVEMDERSLQSQAIHISGRLDLLAVNFEGQYVKKGQKIAELFSTDLAAASQELITASKYDGKIEGLELAAIQKLKNWNISDQQINNILATKAPIEKIEIYSEHEGYVMEKRASQGDYVRTGQVLYTIGKTSRLWLIFSVFESDLSSVRKGSKVNFTTPSLPSDDFEATINYIEPLMNSKTRTATIRAEINNRGNRLKPGMLLNGKISSTSTIRNQSITIPNSAILWTGNKSVVYVKLQEENIPSFQFREVTVASRGIEQSEITAGIDVGEEIVTHGAFSIDAAAQLNNNRSMMNRNITVKKEQLPGSVKSYVASTVREFKDQLDLVLSSYIELKDALVNTDAIAAKKASEEYLNSLNMVDMNLLNGDAHLTWMDFLDGLKSHSEKITQLEDIELQRKQFDFLSQLMIKTVKSFGTNGNSYYVQYCPMANNNEGADWLSTEEGIRNPYFGSKMMRCGSVKLELN